MFRLTLFLSLFCLSAVHTSACSCIGESTVEESFRSAAAVFQGTVVRADTVDGEHFLHKLEYTFYVDKNYKGAHTGRTVQVRTGFGGGDCGVRFQTGSIYLVYAARENGVLTTNICMRTRFYDLNEAEKLDSICSCKKSTGCISPPDSTAKYVIVHFLYGSKPGKGHKDTEGKWFGGIHGGHVYMQVDSTIFSFVPSSIPVHIFAHQKKCRSLYSEMPLHYFTFDTIDCKVTSVYVPLTDSQYVAIQQLKNNYVASVPYDYAFFGMRCAASAYDVLGQVGLVKKRSNFGNICHNFFPKPLRRRLLKRAGKEGYTVVRKQGRKTRKWEKD